VKTPLNQKLLYLLQSNFSIAIDAIAGNKMRAFLTSLGLVFGVASVISMLAIGTGAQDEILQQMKILGANNIIIKPLAEQNEGDVAEDEEAAESIPKRQRFSPGLSLADKAGLQAILPKIEGVYAESVFETTLIRAGQKRSTKLVGVEPAYFEQMDLTLLEGLYFSAEQNRRSKPVCVIGYGIATRFFPDSNPIGQRLKCDDLWLTVVGVLADKKVGSKVRSKLGIRDVNMDVYAPLNTVILRYRDRSLVTRDDINKSSSGRRQGQQSEAKSNYHQLDRLIVQVSETQYMEPLADIINRSLQRRHNDVVDYEIVIPHQLLAQEQRTKSIFNIVLGAIASISLLVGGIGIMNIMLASILERTREIGVRRAVGATERDIIFQFLLEAVVISVGGGLIGILIGYLFSFGIEQLSGITTIITISSIFISFVVSVSIGLIFGILPARKAAEKDPIIALRYE
jgi:putative ABC transport system permease protein